MLVKAASFLRGYYTSAVISVVIPSLIISFCCFALFAWLMQKHRKTHCDMLTFVSGGMVRYGIVLILSLGVLSDLIIGIPQWLGFVLIGPEIGYLLDVPQR